MSSDELQRLLDRVHEGITTIDFDGSPTPCIMLEGRRYDEMLAKIAGEPLAVNTDLNILQDGLGNAFVEVNLTFSKGNIAETFLINAKTDHSFFESLAETSMLAISSPKSQYSKDNVFMIQLPNRQKAYDALEIIRKALLV